MRYKWYITGDFRAPPCQNVPGPRDPAVRIENFQIGSRSEAAYSADLDAERRYTGMIQQSCLIAKLIFSIIVIMNSLLRQKTAYKKRNVPLSVIRWEQIIGHVAPGGFDGLFYSVIVKPNQPHRVIAASPVPSAVISRNGRDRFISLSEHEG